MMDVESCKNRGMNRKCVILRVLWMGLLAGLFMMAAFFIFDMLFWELEELLLSWSFQGLS
jgi:hypothetical protein